MGTTIELRSSILWKMQRDAVSVSAVVPRIAILSETRDRQATNSMPFDQSPSRYKCLEGNIIALADLFEGGDPFFYCIGADHLASDRPSLAIRWWRVFDHIRWIFQLDELVPADRVTTFRTHSNFFLLLHTRNKLTDKYFINA